MVSKNYKPSLTASLERSRHKEGEQWIEHIQIRCTPEALVAANVGEQDQGYVKDNLTGQAICPKLYFFKDTPRMRQILHLA